MRITEEQRQQRRAVLLAAATNLDYPTKGELARNLNWTLSQVTTALKDLMLNTNHPVAVVQEGRNWLWTVNATKEELVEHAENLERRGDAYFQTGQLQRDKAKLLFNSKGQVRQRLRRAA